MHQKFDKTTIYLDSSTVNVSWSLLIAFTKCGIENKCLETLKIYKESHTYKGSCCFKKFC